MHSSFDQLSPFLHPPPPIETTAAQMLSMRAIVLCLTTALIVGTLLLMGAEGTTLFLGHTLPTFHSPVSFLHNELRFTLPLFDESGLETFLALYEGAFRQRKRRLVVMCATSRYLCGGIADRVRGIPYALSLAIVTRRQFIIHPSILTNQPVLFGGDDAITSSSSSSSSSSSGERGYSHHHLLDADCNRRDLIHRLLVDTTETIYVTINCNTPTLDQVLLLQADKDNGTEQALAVIQNECQIPHRCGAAVIHRMDEFKENLHRAHMLVASLVMLPFRNYSALHVRVGGSDLTIGKAVVPAVPWEDAHEGEVPQAWVDRFRAGSFRNCQGTVAIVSDSQRLISELRFAATDNLVLTHCCSQSLHRDRYISERFPFQEVVDLYIMARARRVITSQSGFGTLGRYWLGGSPKSLKLSLTLSAKDVGNAQSTLVDEALCEKAYPY